VHLQEKRTQVLSLQTKKLKCNLEVIPIIEKEKMKSRTKINNGLNLLQRRKFSEDHHGNPIFLGNKLFLLVIVTLVEIPGIKQLIVKLILDVVLQEVGMIMDM